MMMGGMLLMFLLWVGLVAGAIWLVGVLFPRVRSSTPRADASSTARAVLEARYARGEIGREEYQRIAGDIH
jgi:uncharacterized membrane protein